MTEEGKLAMDYAAASSGVYTGASYFGVIAANTLPPLVSILTIAWLAIRIFESKSCQDLIKRFKK